MQANLVYGPYSRSSRELLSLIEQHTEIIGTATNQNSARMQTVINDLVARWPRELTPVTVRDFFDDISTVPGLIDIVKTTQRHSRTQLIFLETLVQLFTRHALRLVPTDEFGPIAAEDQRNVRLAYFALQLQNRQLFRESIQGLEERSFKSLERAVAFNRDFDEVVLNSTNTITDTNRVTPELRARYQPLFEFDDWAWQLVRRRGRPLIEAPVDTPGR